MSRILLQVNQICIIVQKLKNKQDMKTLKEILFLFLVVVSIQSDGEPTKIVLDQVYELALNSNQSFIYEIIIPDNWVSTQNLYITGYSPINDPYQQPILFIKSDNSSQTCSDSSNNLGEVCLIPSQQLSVGKKITVDARCRINCNARLVAYLSEVVQLDLNEQVYIETESSPIEKNFRIFVPTNSQFNQIFLFLRLSNTQNLWQGAQMYLNINSDNSFPSRQKHAKVSLKNWGFDKALILKKGVDVMPGDFINLLLIIPAQTAILFESRNILNSTTYLQLNQILFDYLDESTSQKLYIVDLSSLDEQSLGLPIIIEVKQFSGNPKIQVSLSPEFKKEELSNSLWIRFQIDSEMMKSPQFKKLIYIRVSSRWGATYLLYSKLRRANFNSVFEGLTQYVDIQASNIGVLIYRHNEVFESLNESKSLQLKVENEGEAQAEIRTFQCLQENTFKCEINKDSDLNKLSAQYKEVQVINVKQIIKVKYSASDCLKSKNEEGNSNIYVCTTMFVVIPKQKAAGQYAVTLQPEEYIEALAEGQARFQSVQKQHYRYFNFYLSGDPQQIVELFIYVHLIDGNVMLLASPDVVTPNLKDVNNTAVKTGINQIIFKNLKTGIYYLSVYGQQSSDFVISVIVRRLQPNVINYLVPHPNQKFSQNVKITDIQLKDGLAQIFTLDKGYLEMKFRLRTTGNGNVNLLITQYVGKVQTFYTRDSTHKRQECYGNVCDFLGGKGETFFVEVSGDMRTIRKFAIVFKQINECYKYSTGSPFYIYLEKDDSECQEFAINTAHPVEISNSLTNLQILDKVVEIFVEFQSNQTFVMSQSSHIFTKEELSKYCKQKNECKMKIKYRSFSESVYFHSIVQRIDGVITLYDGVIQRLDHGITSTQGKLFRYPIQSEESIDIFLVSESYSQYTILAQIVEQTQNSLNENYPKKNENKSTIHGFWSISSSADSPALTILHINKKKISKYISENKIKYPWLLVRVLGSNETAQHVIYTLQITQNERSLKEGEVHIGYVQINQIVTYEIYPSTKSLLSIKAMERNKCFKLLDEKKKQLENDVIIQGIKTVPMTFFVQSLTYQNCMYQISLQNYQNSVVTVTQGFPTGVVLEYGQATYLLYYHNRNTSFKVYEFIEVGSSKLYASPLNNFNTQDGISQILDNIALDSFKYKTDDLNNIEVEAQQNSSSYCFSCYYLIAIKGTPSVKEDVVVVPTGIFGVPVIIKEHSIIDSSLESGQNESFIYYSSYTSNFNLSIDVVYGRVTVTVKSYKQGSEGKIQKIQGVQRNTILLPIVQIPAQINSGVPTPTNAIDERTKYKIEVQGVRKASYHLQIIKYSDAFRISQGIASRITIPAMGQIKLEFESILDRDQIKLNIETNLFFLNRLAAAVYFYKSGYTETSRQLIDFKTDTIGKVLTLRIPSMRGHYIVEVYNPLNTQYDMIALMARPGLTQLRELHSIASEQQTLYQIYIEEGNYGIIQVFLCIGDIRVRGSVEIEQLLGGRPHSNQVQLIHQNFGGHYVITTPANVTGQYFIRVQNKQFSAHMNQQVEGISYMISYRMSKINQINPYYLLDAPDYHIGIRRSQKRENISLYAKNVKPINSSIKVKSILYIFAVGSSPEDIKQLMFCKSKKTQKHFIYTTMVTGQGKETQLNISKLQILKRSTSKTHLYFGGTGIAMIEQNGQIADSIIFIYQPSFLGQLKAELVITTFGFFEIMVIISAVIGGSVVIYSLIVHFLKLRLGYFQSNQLVQQQSIQNKVEVKDGEFQISKMKEQKQKEDRSEQELK